LAWALKEAERLGATVEMSAGEAVVRGLGKTTKVNVRKKDCPKHLLMLLRREQLKRGIAKFEEELLAAAHKEPPNEPEGRCWRCSAPHEGQRAIDVFTVAQLRAATEYCGECGWPAFDEDAKS